MFLFKKKKEPHQRSVYLLRLTATTSPPTPLFILKEPSLWLSSCCRNTNLTSMIFVGAYRKAVGEATLSGAPFA